MVLIWFSKGLRVRMIVEGDDLMEESLEILVSCVMGLPPVLLNMFTRAVCSAVSFVDSGWELMKADQLSCIVKV